MSKLTKWFSRMRYHCWLISGGRRTESGFRFLSQNVLKNRKLIYELRQEMRSLKARVWELEDHSPEEWLDETRKACNRFHAQANELAQKIER